MQARAVGHCVRGSALRTQHPVESRTWYALLQTLLSAAHQQQVRATKPIVTSSIDFSHRRTVSDIRFLPAGTDFKKNFKLAFNPNSTALYLASSAGDGCIMIWDVAAAVHSVAIENFQWRPFLQAPLKRSESGERPRCVRKGPDVYGDEDLGVPTQC